MDYAVPAVYGKTNKNKVSVSVVGSKSVTARALLIAAIAKGTTTLYGASLCDDGLTMIDCLRKLGVKCEVSGDRISVEGCGGVAPEKYAEINVGSSGTTARFLIAFLAFQKGGRYKVDSSAQMKARPNAPLFEACRALGAKVICENERFPVEIIGAEECAGEVCVDITKSSQFLSALLISGVCAGKPFKITAVGTHGGAYIDMTLDMMWSFGVTVFEDGEIFTVNGKYSAKKYDIEPDISAACYFYAINKILGTDISVNGLLPHSMQSDIKFIKLLKDFDGGTVDMSEFSDQALTLCAIAPYFSKPTTICNIAHIRGQECDRISAMRENLSLMGVKCEEFQDGIKIYPSQPQPAKIKTFGDHRVAMSFAVTGLRAEGIVISDAEVCRKTFPDYFKKLDYVIKILTD